MTKRKEANPKEERKIDVIQYEEDMAEIRKVLSKPLEEIGTKQNPQERRKLLDEACKSAYTVARLIQDDAEKCEEFSGLLKNMSKTFLQLAHELDERVEFLRGYTTPPPIKHPEVLIQ